MDNISGKANWFAQDVVEPEIIEVEEIPPFVPILDMNLVSGALFQAEHDYEKSHKKNLGDAIVHLRTAITLLQ